MPQLGLGLGANISGSSLYDGDAAAYFTRAGVTDPTAKAQVNAFVKGLKNLGLWSSSVVWPMRSAQNKGSGTTLYSFGGLGTVGQYDGTLVNGPTWNTDGIFFDGSNDRVTLPNGAFGTSNTATTIISFLKNEVNTSRGIFLSQGNNNTGTDAFALGSPDATASTDGVGIAFTDRTIDTKTLSWKSLLIGNTTLGFYGKNGGTVTSYSLANSLNKSGNNSVIGSFGDPSGVAPFNGYAGLVIRINATPTTQLNSDIYNLYVSTMGSNRDLDADGYILRAGVTDPTAQSQINDFVVGVKALGLWDNMVCWPLRLSQNKGSGTTAYSLGGYGTYNATLSSSGMWATDGLSITGSATYMTTGLNLGASPDSLYSVINLESGTLNNSFLFTAGVNLNGRQFDVGPSANPLLDHVQAERDTWYTTAADIGYPTHGYSGITGIRYVSWRPQSNTTINAGVNGSFVTSSLNGWAASTAGAISPKGNVGNTKMSFFAYTTNSAISDSLDNQIRALYKTTLGVGLGLP
jgi:hypothetical protein